MKMPGTVGRYCCAGNDLNKVGVMVGPDIRVNEEENLRQFQITIIIQIISFLLKKTDPMNSIRIYAIHFKSVLCLVNTGD